jgi:hypothetical protein
MKKISILLVSALILVTTFSSCTTDDSGPVDMNLISGKWLFNKSTASSSGITIPYPTPYFKNEDGCGKDFVEIFNGGTLKNGDFSAGCVLTEKDGTWSQSGNTITITVTGSSLSGTFNVSSLSATELILKIDGTYEGKSGTFTLYFTK